MQARPPTFDHTINVIVMPKLTDKTAVGYELARDSWIADARSQFDSKFRELEKGKDRFPVADVTIVFRAGKGLVSASSPWSVGPFTHMAFFCKILATPVANSDRLSLSQEVIGVSAVLGKQPPFWEKERVVFEYKGKAFEAALMSDNYIAGLARVTWDAVFIDSDLIESVVKGESTAILIQANGDVVSKCVAQPVANMSVKETLEWLRRSLKTKTATTEPPKPKIII